MMLQTQKMEMVLVDKISQEELTQVVVDLIRKNSKVRQAIINLACTCPNIVTEI